MKTWLPLQSIILTTEYIGWRQKHEVMNLLTANHIRAFCYWLNYCYYYYLLLLLLLFIIIVIIIIIITILSSYWVFYWVLLIMSQPRPAARRNNIFRNRWAVPRMADNCTVPMNSVTPSLLYQVLARHASKSTSHDRYYRDFGGYMSLSDFKCRLLVLFHLVLLGAYGFPVSLNSYVKTCPFACIFMQ